MLLVCVCVSLFVWSNLTRIDSTFPGRILSRFAIYRLCSIISLTLLLRALLDGAIKSLTLITSSFHAQTRLTSWTKYERGIIAARVSGSRETSWDPMRWTRANDWWMPCGRRLPDRPWEGHQKPTSRKNGNTTRPLTARWIGQSGFATRARCGSLELDQTWTGTARVPEQILAPRRRPFSKADRSVLYWFVHKWSSTCLQSVKLLFGGLHSLRVTRVNGETANKVNSCIIVVITR